jgi:cupin fold WbuC family metalloprotein
MIKITDELLNTISNEAKASDRKRCTYSFHNSNSDYIQRFLNAGEIGTYVRPHKHENPDRVEIFLILKGRFLVIEFDDDGEIIDHIILDSEKGKKGVEIPPKTWHSLIVLKEGSVLYEVKEGPFIMETDKIFAKWAPEEGTKEAQEFNKKIISNLKTCLH